MKLLFIIILVSFSSCSLDNNDGIMITKSDAYKIVGKTLNDDKSFSFQGIEKLLINLDNDNILDTIILEKIHEWNDPGDFQKIKINLSNNNNISVFNKEGWVDTEQLNEFGDFNKKNIVNSKYLTIKLVSSNHYLLFLSGYAYASSPGLLSIIEVKNGVMRQLLNDNYFIYNYKDIDNDNIIDLIVTTKDKFNYSSKAETKVYLLKKNGFELAS
jgi:hypothetical protein